MGAIEGPRRREATPSIGPPRGDDDTPAVRCRGLVERFGDVTAVDGLDLEIARGTCVGLLVISVS